MRLLSSAELSCVAGGNEPTDLGEIVVVGPRRMSDDEIQRILAQYYRDQGYTGGGYAGGGGGGGGGTAPAPGPVTVWEEDVDGDGRVDTLWIDNNGDGEIGVGDGAAFFENGPWSNLNAQQMSDMWAGLQSWLAAFGWETAKDVTQDAATAAAFGHALKFNVTAAGAAGTLPGLVHDFLIATVGNIDQGESNEIQTSHYSDYFGTYNPYTDGNGNVQYNIP